MTSVEKLERKLVDEVMRLYFSNALPTVLLAHARELHEATCIYGDVTEEVHGDLRAFANYLNKISPGMGDRVHDRVQRTAQPPSYQKLKLDKLLPEDREFVLDYMPDFESVYWYV